MRGKLAQLKIQQMSFMLIAVTLLVIIAGLFFVSLMTADIRRGAGDLEEEEAVNLVLKLADLPEFKCKGERVYCIDAEKAIALQNKPEYEKLWPIEGIIIKKLSPDDVGGGGNIECTITNFPDCSVIKINTDKNKEQFSSYVSLCRIASSEDIGIYEKCELAQIMVGLKGEKNE